MSSILPDIIVVLNIFYSCLRINEDNSDLKYKLMRFLPRKVSNDVRCIVCMCCRELDS